MKQNKEGIILENTGQEQIRIVLDDIRHEEKNLCKAAGVTKQEFDECWERLKDTKGECFVEFAKEFNFNPNELFEALKKVDYETEAIVALWKKRERNYISLEEFIQTKVIIDFFRKEMPAPKVIIVFPFPPSPFLPAKLSKTDKDKDDESEKKKKDRLYYI